MKTKNKMLAVVEIAVVLCSMLLVALPATAIAAEEDDSVLGIYGNANEDDTIDMRDLTYVKLIFFGKKPETALADAKYDGKINPLDFIQIKLIIVGKEKEITVVDDFPKIVTIRKPVNRIIPLSSYAPEAIRSLKSMDRIIGVPRYTLSGHGLFFPELAGLPTIGSGFEPDIEEVLELEPDMILAYANSPKPEKFDDKLPENIRVVHLGFERAAFMIEDFEKLGYILNTRDDAKEITDFYGEFNSKINEQVEGLSESKKPRMYLEGAWKKYYAYGKDTATDDACTMAGGINIAGHSGAQLIDPEWVITQNPDIIVSCVMTGSGKCGYEYDDPSTLEAIREEIMSRPELAEVSAVKNEKVYCIAFQIVYKPRYFVGTSYLAKWFHPELFEDLDPEEINKEYLEKFQGMPYRGVYVYPPLTS